MLLSGDSRVYGILGDPVAHSLSPLMQNHALQQHNIDAVYVPFHVSPTNLPAAVDGLLVLNVAGFNVTIPHKEAILPLLGQVDPAAKLIGAVNTVVNKDGVLVGYNTDASGFIRAVREDLNFHPVNRKILILGAGGAARAAAVALATAGVKSIVIANRNQFRGRQFVDDLAPHFASVSFAVVNYSDSEYLDALSEADLVVNATSVGLRGDDVNILPLESIKSSALMYDMVYSFFETPFVKVARSAGFTCVDGMGMLAAQGEDAFFLWTGVRLPAGFMRNSLLNSKKM
ncbi:MAG: shikimate dehydrogenase [Desulfuromonadales bacterium]|nr:shikimate dehydrogenase [Desulfuromonadales bacterium]